MCVLNMCAHRIFSSARDFSIDQTIGHIFRFYSIFSLSFVRRAGIYRQAVAADGLLTEKAKRKNFLFTTFLRGLAR